MLFLLPFIAHGQQMRISLNVTSNPSPYLSDWTTRKQTVILTVVNSDAKSVEVKLAARISRDGVLQVDTKLDKLPIFTVRPGVNTFYGENLVPESAVTFYGDVDKKVVRSGRLPSGSYQFCLRLHNAATLAPLGEEQCRPFKIQSYQGPRLIDPAASATVPPPYMRQTFRWSPVAPAYSPNQQYQLVIMEVRSGQTPTQAFRANRPILTRDIKSATQMIWPTDVALDTPMTYVWSVRALDDAGDPLGEPKDGWAEPRSFSLGRGAHTMADAAMLRDPGAIPLIPFDDTPPTFTDATNRDGIDRSPQKSIRHLQGDEVERGVTSGKIARFKVRTIEIETDDEELEATIAATFGKQMTFIPAVYGTENGDLLIIPQAVLNAFAPDGDNADIGKTFGVWEPEPAAKQAGGDSGKKTKFCYRILPLDNPSITFPPDTEWLCPVIRIKTPQHRIITPSTPNGSVITYTSSINGRRVQIYLEGTVTEPEAIVIGGFEYCVCCVYNTRTGTPYCEVWVRDHEASCDAVCTGLRKWYKNLTDNAMRVLPNDSGSIRSVPTTNPTPTPKPKLVSLGCYPAEPKSCQKKGDGCLVMFPPDDTWIVDKVGVSTVMTGQAEVITGASSVLVYRPTTPNVKDEPIHLEQDVVLDSKVAALLGYTSLTLQKGTYPLDKSTGSFQFAISDTGKPLLAVPTPHGIIVGGDPPECHCCGTILRRSDHHDSILCCEEKRNNPKMHYIVPQTGAIRYFEYDTDFAIDNPEFCKYLGVKQVVIAKGIYRVERSTPEAGGKITLTLAEPVSAEKIRGRSSFTFRGTNPKGKDCKGIGNACFWATEPIAPGDTCILSVTPIINDGKCVAIKLQYPDPNGRGVGSPKSAGF